MTDIMTHRKYLVNVLEKYNILTVTNGRDSTPVIREKFYKNRFSRAPLHMRWTDRKKDVVYINDSP